MKRFYNHFIACMVMILLGTNFSESLAQPYEDYYHNDASSLSRYNVEQKCLQDTLTKRILTEVSYKKNLHSRDSLNKEINLRRIYLTHLQKQELDSLSNQKSYLLKEYLEPIQHPTAIGISYVLGGTVVLLLLVLFVSGTIALGPGKYSILFTTIILFLFCFIVRSAWDDYNKKELFWEIKEKLDTAQSNWNQRAYIISQDNKIIELNQKQRSAEQFIANFEDSIKQLIQPTVEKTYQQQIFQQDSTKKAEARKLEQFIRNNSFRKELRIIACSWEKAPDIPEHGYLDGNLDASGISGGGGVLIGGTGIGAGGGKNKAKGTLHGEYTGRVYGNDYRYFHFVLSDNSYHVIDAVNNKMWRMAVNRLVVRYEKIYSNYNVYKETLTPLYNKTFH